MKIGILTFHRSNNYGAQLQAVALREVLTSMGHTVTFVDYWPSYHKARYALFSWEAMKHKGVNGKIKYIINAIRRHNFSKARIQSFEQFRQEYIYPYLSSVDESFDMVIHGSDQIWKKPRETKVFNPVYFGKNQLRASHQVSYAASMGPVQPTESDYRIVKELLSHLYRISVRETDLASFVQSLGYECEVSLDPTLLLDRKQWLHIFEKSFVSRKTEEKYILFYKLFDNSFDEKKLREFAKRRGCKVKTIHSIARASNTEDNIYIASPITLLQTIEGAEYVFSSSYHGMVFALLFHKPFYAAFSRSESRAKTLLETLGLSNRLLSPMSNIPNDDSIIDFDKVERKLTMERNKSLAYLKRLGN